MPATLPPFFATLPAGVALLEGAALRYGYVNAAMQALVGTHALGQRIEEQPGPLPAALLHQLRPALASGTAAVVAGWRVPGAGPPRYVDLHLEPYREVPAGPVTGLLLLALAAAAPPAAPAAPPDERTLHLLADSLPGLVWLASAEGLVGYYNQIAQHYSGLTTDELGPAGWVGLLHPAEQAPASAQWLQCVATGEAFAGQFRVRRQDSTYRWHLIRAQALEGVLPRCWVGTYTEVEEPYRLRQVLYGQYEALAHVHHDLAAIAYATDHDLLGLRPQVEQVAATIEVDVALAPHLHAGRTGLLTVLYNLLRNALQFRVSNRAPRIVVRSYYAAGGQLVLQVQDNGPGLALADPQPHFTLFAPAASPAGGTGVGLYLVQRIVHQQGGHLEVSSTLGEGATFTVFWN